MWNVDLRMDSGVFMFPLHWLESGAGVMDKWVWPSLKPLTQLISIQVVWWFFSPVLYSWPLSQCPRFPQIRHRMSGLSIVALLNNRGLGSSLPIFLLRARPDKHLVCDIAPKAEKKVSPVTRTISFIRPVFPFTTSLCLLFQGYLHIVSHWEFSFRSII